MIYGMSVQPLPRLFTSFGLLLRENYYTPDHYFQVKITTAPVAATVKIASILELFEPFKVPVKFSSLAPLLFSLAVCTTTRSKMNFRGKPASVGNKIYRVVLILCSTGSIQTPSNASFTRKYNWLRMNFEILFLTVALH